MKKLLCAFLLAALLLTSAAAETADEMLAWKMAEWISIFSNGYAGFLDKNGEYGYVSIEGEVLDTEPPRQTAPILNQGYRVIRENGKYGFANDKGEVVIAPQWDYAWVTGENAILVELDDQFGFLNFQDEVIVPVEWSSHPETKLEHYMYDAIRGGYFALKKDGLYCIFDLGGNLIR